MTIKIPLVVTEDRDLNLFQTQLGKALQPVLKNPLNEGAQLKSVALAVGATTVNHGLGRVLQGWILTRVRAQATIWDTQDANAFPARTLVLNSTAAVTVDLWVY